MARADILSRLYSSRRPANKFNFDMLTGPPVSSLLSPYDVQQIWDINNDPRLNTKLKERLNYIDTIMRGRGLTRITQGTNRACYKYYEDQSFIFKTAISKPGFNDSPREMYNQHRLKPFVTKCFDVSANGIIGSFERVQDITSAEQFKSIADDVFTLLNDHIIGKYVMADIGTKYFRNYGIRLGFGPVILDYPMLFEVDGDKLFCNAVNRYTGEVCGGQIDYDAGFNNLYCEKCGKMYLANELEKKVTSGDVIKRIMEMPLASKRRTKMNIVISDGKNEINIKEDVTSSNIYVEKEKKTKEKGIVITDGSKVLADIKVDSVKVEEAVKEEPVAEPEVEEVVEEAVEESEVEAADETVEETTEVSHEPEVYSSADGIKYEGPVETEDEEETSSDDDNNSEQDEDSDEVSEESDEEELEESDEEESDEYDEEEDDEESDEEDDEEDVNWVDASDEDIIEYIKMQHDNVVDIAEDLADELCVMDNTSLAPPVFKASIEIFLSNMLRAHDEKKIPEDSVEDIKKRKETATVKPEEVNETDVQSPEELAELIKGKVDEDMSNY